MMSQPQSNDLLYMKRAVELASRAEWAHVQGNPKVGAVLVYEGRVIGEGYHHYSGGPHAEVNCISSVKLKDRQYIPKSTLYVTLEPCCHFGKTAPCSDLIVHNRIPRVVIGCRDPFPKVNGGGIRQLQTAGVEVTVGVLWEECYRVAHHFFANQFKRRPFITLKWAQSVDGFIGACTAEGIKQPFQLSSPLTSTMVHKLRAEHDAILVGGETFRTDQPSLNVRFWKGQDPIRLILSRDSQILQKEGYLGEFENWRVLTPTQELSLLEILQKLYREESVRSLLVEGGSQTLKSFIDQGLWDVIRVETAPYVLQKGTRAPSLAGLEIQGTEQLERTEMCVDGRIIIELRRLHQ